MRRDDYKMAAFFCETLTWNSLKDFGDIFLCLIVLVLVGKLFYSIEFVINIKFMCSNLFFLCFFPIISSLIQFLAILILSKKVIFLLGTYI